MQKMQTDFWVLRLIYSPWMSFQPLISQEVVKHNAPRRDVRGKWLPFANGLCTQHVTRNDHVCHSSNGTLTC